MLEVFSALLINGKLLTLLLRFERGPLGSFLLLVCELSMSSRVCMYVYTLCIWHFHLANGHKQGTAAAEEQGIPSISLIEIVGSNHLLEYDESQICGLGISGAHYFLQNEY